MNKPKLILADEPTGNLDSQTASEVFELFREVKALHAQMVGDQPAQQEEE